MRIFELKEIKQTISFAADLEELIKSQKAAFVDFSSGLYKVPPPMQFVFPEYHSDCHIKGGYRHENKNLVIKIATGSPSTGGGVILIFAADTGALKIILHDRGFLTTLRTAIAGIIVSELAPWHPQNIGIIGSGNLGTMLYDLIRLKYPTANTMIYARNKRKAKAITDNVCDSIEELVTKCDVIFTATSASHILIHDINNGSNKTIIGLGSDDEHKTELATDIFGKGDVVIVDSQSQAAKFGDVARAIRSGIITPTSCMELGNALKTGITAGTKTIIADLSGIAAQDVAIAEFVLSRLQI
jgi:ornithine cyclodeaminase